MTSLWPFAVWEIDLIDQFPKERGSMQQAVVAINYFTKWVEAKALASITPRKIKEFVHRNIVCRYGVPHTIISDNDKQFNCDEFKEFYDNLQIKKVFSLVARPQANGQVEAINKTIKHNLKVKLQDLKRRWVDELPKILQASRTIARTSIGEILYSFTYSYEVMVPIEIRAGPLRRENYDSDQNFIIQ